MDIEIIKDRYNYRYDICTNCKSELKIKKSKIKYQNNKGYEVATIRCPCCNKDFVIHQ